MSCCGGVVKHTVAHIVPAEPGGKGTAKTAFVSKPVLAVLLAVVHALERIGLTFRTHKVFGIELRIRLQPNQHT